MESVRELSRPLVQHSKLLREHYLAHKPSHSLLISISDQALVKHCSVGDVKHVLLDIFRPVVKSIAFPSRSVILPPASS